MATVEFVQKAAYMGRRTDWTVPWVNVSGKWRVIDNKALVKNPTKVNAYDEYADAIFRIQNTMEQLGWKTELSERKQDCHEHLYYVHHMLICTK